VRSSEHLGQP